MSTFNQKGCITQCSLCHGCYTSPERSCSLLLRRGRTWQVATHCIRTDTTPARPDPPRTMQYLVAEALSPLACGLQQFSGARLKCPRLRTQPSIGTPPAGRCGSDQRRHWRHKGGSPAVRRPAPEEPPDSSPASRGVFFRSTGKVRLDISCTRHLTAVVQRPPIVQAGRRRNTHRSPCCKHSPCLIDG